MLSDVQYRHIIAGRSALQGKIDTAERDKEEYDRLKKLAQATKDRFSEEMSFYTNFMKDAIEEYEAAHPPETP